MKMIPTPFNTINKQLNMPKINGMLSERPAFIPFYCKHGNTKLVIVCQIVDKGLAGVLVKIISQVSIGNYNNYSYDDMSYLGTQDESAIIFNAAKIGCYSITEGIFLCETNIYNPRVDEVAFNEFNKYNQSIIRATQK